MVVGIVALVLAGLVILLAKLYKKKQFQAIQDIMKTRRNEIQEKLFAKSPLLDKTCISMASRKIYILAFIFSAVIAALAISGIILDIMQNRNGLATISLVFAIGCVIGMAIAYLAKKGEASDICLLNQCKYCGFEGKVIYKVFKRTTKENKTVNLGTTPNYKGNEKLVQIIDKTTTCSDGSLRTEYYAQIVVIRHHYDVTRKCPCDQVWAREESQRNLE